MQPPQVPPSGAIRSRYALRTRWSDEDNQRVLNNAVYLTLFEEARLAYFTELGLMDENQFSFVLAQTNVRFLRPGVGGAEVVVELATTHVGNSSFTQAYRVVPAGGGADEAWAEGEALLVAWDNGARAKRAMAPEFRAALVAREGLDPASAPGGDAPRST